MSHHSGNILRCVSSKGKESNLPVEPANTPLTPLIHVCCKVKQPTVDQCVGQHVGQHICGIVLFTFTVFPSYPV